MKTKLLALILCGFVTIGFTACPYDYNFSTSGQTVGVVTDDRIVVSSEIALNSALDTFDFLLKLRHDNPVLAGKVPGLNAFCRKIQANGKNWIKSLEVAHDAYKGSRTSLNHASLITAYNTLQAAITEAKKYTTQIGG